MVRRRALGGSALINNNTTASFGARLQTQAELCGPEIPFDPEGL